MTRKILFLILFSIFSGIWVVHTLNKTGNPTHNLGQLFFHVLIGGLTIFGLLTIGGFYLFRKQK